MVYRLIGPAVRTAAISAAVAVLLGVPFEGASAGDAPEVIELTQTGCQFLEPEGEDHGFKTAGKADCVAINEDSGAERVADAGVLELKPGRYIFRVSNQNVPYELGFWLRGDGSGESASLPSISGGGLVPGASRDYEIELVEGDYVYSCPLNPTPNYRVRVTGG